MFDTLPYAEHDDPHMGFAGTLFSGAYSILATKNASVPVVDFETWSVIALRCLS